MVVVLATQVVDVAGADEFAAHLTSDLDDSLVALVLGGEPVLLHLEVDVVLPEDAYEVVGVSARVCGTVVEQALAEARGETPCERDDALRALLDLGQVEVGLASAQSFQKAGR